MFKGINNILFLVVPLLLKYVFLLCFIDWVLFDIQDIIEDAFFLIVIIVIVNSDIVRKQLFGDILFLIYLFYLILETTSYMAVSSNFSSSFMYLLLESNRDEFREFSSSYINFPIVLFVMVMIIMFFKIRKLSFKSYFKYRNIIAVLGVVFIVFTLKVTGLIESNAYHNIVRGTYGYIDLQSSMKFSNVIKKEDILITSNNEILVVVLGESTARGHMQIYGYHRETTPKLNTIKNNLYAYNNVISTDVFTLKAVPKIITSIDIESNNESDIHLVELFNTAGYDTYWLSNQRPISYHDNAISKIASASKWFKFYNHLIDKHSSVLDETLLPDYKNILEKPGNKVIFVRLMGTHFDYNKRYPEAYNKFALDDKETSKKETLNNQYDNAVLYNDYIIYRLIELLNEQQQKSALLYLSDHGENIYDGTDFFGRSEEVLTKSMFEIPFLLWTSKDFNYPEDFVYEPNRKFMADHTFESIGHVFGIQHKDMDLGRSIFSKTFAPRKRKVLGTIDFDTYFIDE
ncbi:heptose-I-phosphate ethanolaminephosphotransferase [Hyunsoonleella jejuensis]|uniref:Heptose-I-phosphate ethanolaminephosphotransferase n=1 Tax=Hyunsoonleella jejuensis TaxID=419940 RepID=A0A1H9J9C6_9FLAO|nr:phosphoethanolamine transferase [Hyunsoonleella jejuensis]SEQ83484.1 heptose-I-phosphate ethanolaminephosphotransferase [Hyunsoonleella jejuensis]